MQTARLGLSIAMTVSLLTACGPTRQEIEADVGAAVEAETPTVPESFSAPTSAEDVQVGWIESFNDPALVKLVKEAQANNQNLRAAAANVERARALAKRAGAALTPDVDLTAGAARAGSPGDTVATTSDLGVGLQVSWELDVWGRVRAGARGAAASAQAVEADYRYAQHSLAAATARAYFTAIEANLQTNNEGETVGVLEETMRIVNDKYENGMGSSQDVPLARSDLATARERLTTAEGSYRDALRALEILLGRYPSAELAVRKLLPDVPPPPPAGVPSEVLERRPDIVAAERRVAAAFNTVQQAKAARLPKLSLTGNLGGASSSLSSVTDSSSVTWRLATNLLAPIFDGGRLRAQVEIATAEQEQSLAAYGETALKAFSELETSLDQGVVVAQREVDLKEAAEEAGEAFRIANLRYQEGLSDLLSVLTIRQRVIDAKRNLASVQRLGLEQRINLHLALGGSWES